MSLIVTGSIGIDSIESPAGNVDNVLGGSAIYFAAAASFFSPVRLVAAVGEDFPAAFLEDFRHFNVDLAGLEQRQGSKTFRWRGRYHTNMNHRDTVSVELNVLAEKLPPVPGKYQDSEYIFLANTHPAGQIELLEQFPQRKLAVADTMDLWINNEKPTLLKLLQRVDGLVLNNDEAEMLAGDSNVIKAAARITELGPKFVVVKKGEHGVFVTHGGAKIVLPAWPAEAVVDPTGAGDSFAGGMMGYLASTGDLSANGLRKAMACGTIAASFNIESFSLGRLKQISRADIDARLREFSQMLRLDN
ncbi:MAG: sugar kinase [Phycisphaeraceae bacterium]|nr:sugar kinase [Phycisphaeraceae bacterium]